MFVLFIYYINFLAGFNFVSNVCLVYIHTSIYKTKQQNVGNNSNCLYMLMYVMGRKPSKTNILLSLSFIEPSANLINFISKMTTCVRFV